MSSDNVDMNDNGFASRKFWLTVGTSALIFVGGVLGIWWSAVGSVYPAMIGGLLASLATFCGANIGAKFVLGRNAAMLGGGDAAANLTKNQQPDLDQHRPD